MFRLSAVGSRTFNVSGPPTFYSLVLLITSMLEVNYNTLYKFLHCYYSYYTPGSLGSGVKNSEKD